MRVNNTAAAAGGASPEPDGTGDNGPLVSIVVLTFNQVDYTRVCLESLRRNTSLPYELIIVDNASQDGTTDYLRSLSGARLVLNSANRGFAGGCNQGLSLARGRWALLLNNDTILPPGWLERLLAAADRKVPSSAADDRTAELRQSRGQPASPLIAGIVGPRSNAVVGPQLVREVPYEVAHPASASDVEPDGIGAFEAYAQTFARRRRGRTFVVDRVIGFCMLIRREVIDTLGALDERFGRGNFEDDDYCLRARLAGFSIIVADDSFIHHYGGRSFVGNQIDYVASMESNFAHFRAKWGLPQGPIGQGYNPAPLLARPFDPKLDFLPLPPPPPSISVSGLPPSPVTAPETGENDVDPVLGPGLEALQRGDLTPAIVYLRRAVQVAPDSAPAWYFLGCALLQADDAGAALRALTEAVQLDPTSSDILTALGSAMAATGDTRSAQRTLTRALELDDRNAETWFQLGLVCQQLGHLSEARLGLRQAALHDPTHQPARDALTALDAI